MPDITLGQLLVVAGLLDAFAAAVLGVLATRHQGYTPGTPQYARERNYRRNAILMLVSAMAFVLIGLATWDMVLIGGDA